MPQPSSTEASPTLGQVADFYALLCDLGIDAYFDEVAEQQRAQVTGRPVNMAEQTAAGQPGVQVIIKLGTLMRRLVETGGIERSAVIAMGCTVEEARTLDLALWRSALVPFAMRSIAVLSVFTLSAPGMGSASPLD